MKMIYIKTLIIFLVNTPVFALSQANNCKSNFPSILFRGDEIVLRNQSFPLLSIIADSIKQYPQCNLKVKGYADGTKQGFQKSWDRVYATIKYLTEKQGISENRFIFDSGNSDGNYNSVDISATSENGPNMVPAPHPNLRYSSKSPSIRRQK